MGDSFCNATSRLPAACRAASCSKSHCRQSRDGKCSSGEGGCASADGWKTKRSRDFHGADIPDGSRAFQDDGRSAEESGPDPKTQGPVVEGQHECGAWFV